MASKKSDIVVPQLGINEPRQYSDETLDGLQFSELTNLTLSDLSESDAYFLASLYESTQKDSLIGNPFVITQWKFSTGNFGDFVIVKGVLSNDHRFYFTDGGSGIKRQLQSVTDSRVARGIKQAQELLVIPNGLRVSRYYLDDDGSVLPRGETSSRGAATYYLA